MVDISEINVLLIEDNPGDAKLVEIYLRESSYGTFNLTNAQTLKAGMGLLDENKYDIVLLDLSLPDSHGFSTLTRLVEMYSSISIVVLTGTDDEELGIQAVQSGAQDFMVKGKIDTFSLTRSIRYAVERNKMQQTMEVYSRDLKISQQRLLEAQKIAQIGNYELNIDNQLMYWSDELFRTFGLNPNEYAPSLDLYLKYVNQDDKAKVNAQFNAAKLQGWNFSFEHEVSTEYGETKFVRNQGEVKQNPELGVVINGTVQDITDYKMTQNSLATSEERFRTIVENSKDAIYATSSDGELTEFNPAMTDLLGYSKDEITLLNVSSLYESPETRKTLVQNIFEFGFVKDYDLKLKKKNGSIIDCLLTASLWEGDKGQPKGFQGIIRDVTEKKKTEELIKQKQVAERSARLKEMFLANMSHEIRTPLNVVVGMANLLFDTNPSSKQLEYINGIVYSSENLLKIINDILDFSKIEAGKLEIDERSFYLKDIVDDLIKTYRYKATEKNLTLKTNLDATLPVKVIGDPVRLNQVLLNLISNAIKYTDEGIVELKVEVLSEKKQMVDLRFSIKDSGIGISKTNLDKVFQSFTQVSMDSKRKVGGTGLGLTIVKQLIDLMNGKIDVQSTLGEGTTFSFDLTLEKDILDEPIKLKDDLKNTVQEIGAVKILLVEDHKLNQIVTTNLLKRWWKSIEIDIADNGKIAVDKTKEGHYDLILMDLQMPVMDGYEATQEIRKEFKSVDLPIIALTAHALKHETKKCYDVGMNDFLTKPINPELLAQKIIDLIQVGEFKSPIETQQLLVKQEPQTEKVNPKAELIDINLEYLNTLSGGDSDLKVQMIEQLIEDLPGEVKDLELKTDAKEWTQVAAIAHKMKSTVAYLGLGNFSDKVVDVIHCSRELRDLDSLQAKVNYISQIMLDAHKQLQKELSILTALK